MDLNAVLKVKPIVMKEILTAPVIWFIIGFVFLVLEFMLPGLILFFFAVGAWIVALVLLFSPISINIQLLVFIGSSVVTILLFRKWLQGLLWHRNDSREILEEEFLGRTAVADTNILPGENGKVSFKGTTWDAKSEDVILQGNNVTIVGNDSILLIVKLKTTT